MVDSLTFGLTDAPRSPLGASNSPSERGGSFKSPSGGRPALQPAVLAGRGSV